MKLSGLWNNLNKDGKWRLGHLLTLQIGLVSTLPMLLVALVTVLWMAPQFRQGVVEHHRQLADSIADQIITHLQGSERELAALARQLSALSNNATGSEQLQQLLDAQVGTGDVYESISLVSPEGLTEVIGLPAAKRSLRSNFSNLDISQKAYFHELGESSTTVWSDTYLSLVSARISIAMILPLGSQYLVAEIALDQLARYITELQKKPDLVTLIIDNVGQLVARSDDTGNNPHVNLRNLAIVREALQQTQSSGEFQFQQQTFVGSAQQIETIGWLVMVAQPADEAYQESTLWLHVIAATLLITLMLAAATAIWLARGQQQKIALYARNAQAISEGEYPTEWPQSTIHEFDHFASSLAAMARAIQQRELAQQNSEANLRATMELAPNIAIQWYLQDGTVRYWNQASERLYGHSAEEVLGARLDISSHLGVHIRDLKAYFNQIAESGIPAGPLEMQARHRDNSQRFILSTLFMIRDTQGAPLFVAMEQDITEQKRIAQQLSSSEKRFRAVIEQSPVAVIVWDLQFRVSDWNLSAERIFGYRKETAIGQHASFIIPDASREEVNQVLRELLANRGGFHNETRNITADGRQIDCNWHNQPILNEQGLVVAVVSAVEDITERQRLERATRFIIEGISNSFGDQLFSQATLHLGRAVEADFAFIARINPQTERADTIATYAHGQMVDNVSYDLTDTPCEKVLTDGVCTYPSQITQLFPKDRLLQEMGIEGYVGQSLKDAQGEVIGLLVALYQKPITQGDFIRTVIQIFSGRIAAEMERFDKELALKRLNEELEARVITRTADLQQALDNLHLAQQELVQSGKLAALGSLVAGIAHELNTPIGNSLMAASTLADEMQHLNQELATNSLKRSSLEAYVQTGQEGSAIIERNLHKASELISSFKQVAVDQTSSQRRRFELSEVVNEIAITLGPTFKKTPFLLTTDIEAGLQLDSYPGSLGQVLTNLLNNAILHAFAGRESGTVTITARAEDEDSIRLEVRDDGAGIADEIQARIFDPFFTTRLGSGGSGLGLNIVHNLVTQVLGGRIQLHSHVTQGSCFTLILPCVAPTSQPE